MRVADDGSQTAAQSGTQLGALTYTQQHQMGITIGFFDKVTYITPRVSGSGPGVNFGSFSWLNCGGEGAYPFRQVHELGHSLGLGHAAAITAGVLGRTDGITSYAPVGAPGALGYGETNGFTSVMSYLHFITHPNVVEKASIGWATLTPHDATKDATYQLTALEVPGTNHGITTTVTTPAGSRTYWVEYRQPIGFDVGLSDPRNYGSVNNFGLVIYLTDANAGAPVSELVINPRSTDVGVGSCGFAVGEGFDDQSLRIEHVADGKVRIRPSPVVTPPPIQSQGVSQVALVQSIQTAASALVAGSITQAQIDALKASVNQLVPDASGTPARTIAFANLGFETPAINGFVYNPTNAVWAFSDAGLTVNNSGFTAGDPNAPQGSQSGFLQNARSSIKQTAQIDAGSYTLTFKAIQRANYQFGSQVIDVRLDGASIGRFTPPLGSWGTATMPMTIATTGPHEIAFFGLGAGGNDFTAFIDDVKIA
jgi:hypothetical protein